MLTNSVSMIPFALLSGRMVCGDGECKEIRITELAEDGFCFRTAMPIEDVKEMRLHFFVEKTKVYDEVVLQKPVCCQVQGENSQFFKQYEVTISDERYKDAVQSLLHQYYRYIQLKMDGDDAYLSQVYTGYPAQLDEQITKDFAKQKKQWFDKILGAQDEDLKTKNAKVEVVQNCELALELDCTTLYEKYLSQPIDSYVQMYWKNNGLENHWISSGKIKRLYIGNQFCHNLFPKQQIFKLMLDKAKREGLTVTVVFTYLREELIGKTKEVVDGLYHWCKKENFPVELVINDWGMLSLIQDKKDYFTPTLGVLLNKRRKDPRMQYKLEVEHGSVRENALNSEFYAKHLQEKYGVERFEFESCGYEMEIPDGKHSLHLPFYQTNTSQYCTLYARCKEGSRGCQKFVTNCAEYCRDYVFSYPDHLHMVGRYNSLFGMDTEILGASSKISYYVEHGIDRIVVNMM